MKLAGCFNSTKDQNIKANLISHVMTPLNNVSILSILISYFFFFSFYLLGTFLMTTN